MTETSSENIEIVSAQLADETLLSQVNTRLAPTTSLDPVGMEGGLLRVPPGLRFLFI